MANRGLGSFIKARKPQAERGYTAGAARVLEISLRVTEERGFDAGRTMQFISRLCVVVNRMRRERDIAAPFLDRAVAQVLEDMDRG